jgi:DNA-binding HxlR family transcriptional regulator
MTQDSRPGEQGRDEGGRAAARLHAPGAQPADSTDWDRVAEVVRAVNGTWRLDILRALASGASRPNEILYVINGGRAPGPLHLKVMLETLREMVKDGLVNRFEGKRKVPREVYYWPTDKGDAILTELSWLGVRDSRWRPGAALQDPPPPPGVDVAVPSPARIWNALVGGKDHFAVDRAVVREIVPLMPGMPKAARLARRFQRDAVQGLVGDGARQFIDIGTGLPVAGAVHEVAWQTAPDTRVVYVDNDPMVLSHGRALLASGNGATSLVEADVREPGKILAQAARTLDMGRPVAVIMMMILHFLADSDDPWGIVRELLDGLPAGSWLVISHVGADIAPETGETAAVYNEKSPVSVQPRSAAEVTRFFTQAGAELQAPGLVPLARWWPAEDLPVADSNAHVGIGRRAPAVGAGLP